MVVTRESALFLKSIDVAEGGGRSAYLHIVRSGGGGAGTRRSAGGCVLYPCKVSRIGERAQPGCRGCSPVRSAGRHMRPV